MVPLPPLMSTPPSSTTVTTISVSPVPLSARALVKRAVEDDAGERRDHARTSDEQRGPERRDADAGVARRVLVLADREDLPADPGPVRDEARRRRRGSRTRPASTGSGVPGMLPKPKSVKPAGKLLMRPRAEHDVREAAEEGEGAEGDDERRQAATGDEQAVEEPAGRAHDQDDGDADLERHAGRPQEARGRRSASPTIDSTERSMSPVMMIRVMGRAMIATSITAAVRFAKLPAVRKTSGDVAVPRATIPRSTSARRALPARQPAQAARRADGPRGHRLARPAAVRFGDSSVALIGCAGVRRRPPDAPDQERVERDGDQDHRAVDRLEPVLRQAQEEERVVDEAQEEGAQRRPRRPCPSRRRCRRRRRRPRR